MFDRIGKHQHLGDLERFLGAAGLADQERFNIDAQTFAPCRIERVLGVNESRDASVALRLGDGMQSDRRLAARLGTKKLDDPAARQSLTSERQIK